MDKQLKFDAKPNFPEMEQDILKFWEEKDIFNKSLEQTKAGKPFVFFEGPPTANAKPALHHVEARAFKDMIPRYQTMRGRYVLRKAGWDTHGLPVELQIEKALGISGKKQIESIRPTIRESVIEFNRLCKQSVWEYKDEWEKMTKRMGFWVDLKNPYITYHNKYIESVWAILKHAWDENLVYLGHKVLPYCYRCGTALSSHEVALGYQTVKDNSVFVKFRVKGEGAVYILSWTTTPWTLPGNVALAVGKDIDYVKVKVGEEFYILAKARLADVLPDLNLEADDVIVEEMKGADILGWEYEPLFDIPSLHSPKSYKVYDADFVTTTDGTGVVHTAVMYGEDDYQLGEKIGLPKIHTVDEFGNFTKEVKDLAGKPAKNADTEILIFKHLKANGNWLKGQKYEHEYPHCWRCNTPLLYYARDSWFIRMSSLREDLIKNNEQVSWNPSYIKYGRFGEWLAEVKDWAISRDRYWGTPLPIWKCSKCDHHQMIGSIKDLNLNKNTFYFSRHGEAESNVAGLHINYPEPKPMHLTPQGREQAQNVGKMIKQAGGVDMIFASDITRTKETAEIAGKILGVEVKFDERLREYNLGELNGHPLSEFHEKFPVNERWQKAPKGGETYMQLQNRMLDFVAELNTKYNGKKILVVTHGDVIWLLNQYYDLDNRYPQVGEFTQTEIELTDLHRPYIDEVKIPCEKCGETSQRIPAVLDVWFDSGAMPFAQWHYPFSHKEIAESQFPADFISEAIDQTRGWFYTLLAISTLLGRGPAYKQVISLGHLLDEKGLKMSKSKGNVLNPWELFDKQGADAVRWYMYSVNQPGDSKLFSERDLDLVVRKNFLTLWNVLSFYITYSGFDNWTPTSKPAEVTDVLDKWILVKTQELVNDVTMALDSFDAFKSTRKIEEYINELSTWYVRRSRERKGPAVYQTMHSVLRTLTLLMAPFAPFLAESMWQHLKMPIDAESVHLAQWPEVKTLTSEEVQALANMEAVREAASLALNMRKTSNIPIRQPLAALDVVLKENGQLSDELLDILSSEINVKKIDTELRTGKSAGVVSAKGVQYLESMHIDTTLTQDLKLEGLARNLERIVQDMRKKSGLKVGEIVNLAYHTDDEDIRQAMSLFDRKKTFVNEIQTQTEPNQTEEADLDGKKVRLEIVKK